MNDLEIACMLANDAFNFPWMLSICCSSAMNLTEICRCVVRLYVCVYVYVRVCNVCACGRGDVQRVYTGINAQMCLRVYAN